MSESDRHLLAPINTTIQALYILTDEQKYRLSQLVQDWRAQSASVYKDHDSSDESGYVVFVLFNSEGGHILSGLIEPDGRSHT